MGAGANDTNDSDDVGVGGDMEGESGGGGGGGEREPKNEAASPMSDSVDAALGPAADSPVASAGMSARWVGDTGNESGA